MAAQFASKTVLPLLLALGVLAAAPVGAQPSGGPLIRDIFVAGDDDQFDPGLSVGAPFPAIRALHSGGEISDINAFMGEHGLAVFAVRSVDWCPFCRSQMAELESHMDAYAAAGIGVVAISYDSPELQQKFIDSASITYPWISDIDAVSISALGILNEDYSPGDTAYGIPHPGVFIVDTEGVIAGKVFVESYRVRVDGASTLDYARHVLSAD